MESLLYHTNLGLTRGSSWGSCKLLFHFGVILQQSILFDGDSGII